MWVLIVDFQTSERSRCLWFEFLTIRASSLHEEFHIDFYTMQRLSSFQWGTVKDTQKVTRIYSTKKHGKPKKKKKKKENAYLSISFTQSHNLFNFSTQSAGDKEYIDCISVEG